MNDAGYDVIGDVHGQADALASLLIRMDYREIDGTWRHATRQAVFVGDLTDRGPAHREVYRIVRSMVENDTAQIVAGNHEFNAVLWHTPDPDQPGAFLRNHETKRKHHDAFLDQVVEWSHLHDELIEWFMTLPLWLELDGLRVVHACWDQASIDMLRAHTGPNNSLTPELVVRAARAGTPEWRAVENLLKGPEIPVSRRYRLTGDIVRRNARFNWWDPSAADSVRSAVIIPASATSEDGSPYPPLPDTPVENPPVEPYADEIPVIYGHYWMPGGATPEPTGPHTACVDYSAVRGGPLVAYRWSGESVLTAANFATSTLDHRQD